MTKNIDTAQPLESGTIAFIENSIPTLQDGDYTLSVEQVVNNTAVTDPTAKDYINESYISTKKFTVKGPRFSLPPQSVYSNFPPTNSQGDYDTVLPHIVLSEKTLPWQRSIDGSDDHIPWLALLIFDEGEPAPKVMSVQVGDLQHDQFAHSSGASKAASNLPATTASYEDSYKALGLTFGLDYGENYYDPCNVIDIPISLFESVAPNSGDLTWLAHCRKVSSTQFKEDSFSSSGDSPSFSTIISNRMPAPNTKCTAYLVSLDGMSAFLPTGDEYAPATITLKAGGIATDLRLACLSSWSFTSVDPKETFTGLLEGLNPVKVMKIKKDVPGSGAHQSAVNNALDMGYTAINHETRQGCNTVSWYRGPFVPFNTPSTIFIPLPDAATNTDMIKTADQVIRYNPDTGMMDVTYGAAWEIGRLLSLKSKDFSTGLYKWKRENTRKTILSVEAQALEDIFGDTLGLTKDDLLNNPASMHHGVAGFIVNNLKQFYDSDGSEEK